MSKKRWQVATWVLGCPKYVAMVGTLSECGEWCRLAKALRHTGGWKWQIEMVGR